MDFSLRCDVVFLFVPSPITSPPAAEAAQRLRRDEEVLDAPEELWQPVVGVERRVGPNAAGVLVILSKHTFYIRLHLSLCQRSYEQVGLVHLTVIAVLVPQIQEQIVEVIWKIQSFFLHEIGTVILWQDCHEREAIR